MESTRFCQTLALVLGFAVFLGSIPFAAQDQVPHATFSEETVVQIYTLKIRPVDRFGALLPGLEAEDLEVKVGRQEVRVLGLDWMAPEFQEFSDETDASIPPTNHQPPRLVVLFVQSSHLIHRALGLRWVLLKLDTLLESLHPKDRVAVVSFEFHLELRDDFTLDRERSRRAVADAILFEHSPVGPAMRGSSLRPEFNPEEAFDIAWVEEGLEFTARALERLEGDKILFFLGWGLGREHAGWAGPRYYSAIEALQKADVTVSSLAVGNLGGGVSNLDLSLARIATDTGGSYAKLYPHVNLALKRLSRSLEGYYLLSFEAPNLKRPEEVSVKLREGRNPVHYPYLKLVPE